MTLRDELALHADRLRLQHHARHGNPTPLRWEHLKPSEQQHWLTRAEQLIREAGEELHLYLRVLMRGLVAHHLISHPDDYEAAEIAGEIKHALDRWRQIVPEPIATGSFVDQLRKDAA